MLRNLDTIYDIARSSKNFSTEINFSENIFLVYRGCKLGSSRQYDAVQKYVDEQQVGCRDTNIFRIVDEIPSHCGSGSIWIFLLGLDIANELDVSDIFQSVCQNLPFVNETNCVSAFYSASNSLS